MVTDIYMENCAIKGPPLHQVWKDMETLVDKKLARSIGFSNCGVVMLIEMLAGCNIKPANNQIEINPYMNQTKLTEFFQKFGVSLTAYAPMGSPMRTKNDVINNDVLKEIAVKHNANPG